MRVISSGRPERKDVTEAIEQWKRESVEKKLKMQQEWAKKRQELVVSETPAAQ